MGCSSSKESSAERRWEKRKSKDMTSIVIVPPKGSPEGTDPITAIASPCNVVPASAEHRRWEDWSDDEIFDIVDTMTDCKPPRAAEGRRSILGFDGNDTGDTWTDSDPRLYTIVEASKEFSPDMLSDSDDSPPPAMLLPEQAIARPISA